MYLEYIKEYGLLSTETFESVENNTILVRT